MFPNNNSTCVAHFINIILHNNHLPFSLIHISHQTHHHNLPTQLTQHQNTWDDSLTMRERNDGVWCVENENKLDIKTKKNRKNMILHFKCQWVFARNILSGFICYFPLHHAHAILGTVTTRSLNLFTHCLIETNNKKKNGVVTKRGGYKQTKFCVVSFEDFQYPTTIEGELNCFSKENKHKNNGV